VDRFVVDQFDPGLERGVEVLEGREFRRLDLGQELGAHRAEEALDLAAGVGGIRGRVDLADAEGGAGGGELSRDVDLAVVDVERLGEAAAQDRHLEDPFEPGQVLFEEELAVGDQPGVVVDEGEERRPTVLARALGVGQVGADEHVALPEGVGRVSLESTEGLRLTAELLAGHVSLQEDAA
jgi:hypothetical protein